MSIDLDALRGSDELPAGWDPIDVVAVVRASGRLGGNNADAFHSWFDELATAVEGAIYDLQLGEHTYIHGTTDGAKTRSQADVERLIVAKDFLALAGWVEHERDADAGHRLEPMLTRAINDGDIRVGIVLERLWAIRSADRAWLADLILRAAELPRSPDFLREIASAIAAEREVKDVDVPEPASAEALFELIEDAIAGDQRCQQRFIAFASQRTAAKQAIVLELARSGRGIPGSAAVRLSTAVQLPASVELEEGFAEHGQLAQLIAEDHQARSQAAADSDRQRKTALDHKRAENDALYGRERNRPRFPEAVIALVRTGDLDTARSEYRRGLPEHADLADAAIADYLAFLALQPG